MWKVAVGGMVSALVLGIMPVTVSVIVLVKKLKAGGELKRASLLACSPFLCVLFFMVCV